MNREERGLIIHPEDFKDLLSMDALEAGHIIQNVLKTHLGMDNLVPFSDRYLKRVSSDMCGHNKRDNEQYDRKSAAGKQGGAPIGNSNRKQAKNKQKTSKNQAENKQTSSPISNIQYPISNNKRLYGECENVLLSDEEYQKVKDQGLEGLIEELSLYIAGTGKKYKSHYAVIRQWANRRKKEAKVIKETPFNTGYSRRADDDYDLAKLIKN